jgi:NAD(P)-dependent dehydrogenase (short-subunit alcohol dehydrogenase family)
LADLEGKVAVITGALGLLGRAHCLAFASAGATVVLTDLDAAGCHSLAEQLPNAYGHAADITDEASLQRLRTAVLDRFGRIDSLLNNAAVNDVYQQSDDSGALSRLECYPVEMFEHSLKVNVTGTFLSCRILGAPMAERGAGSIVNVASTYGLVGPDQSIYRREDGSQSFYKSAAYPTSKGAVIAFTKYLAAYWGSRGVRVNCLCPGGVFNEQEEHFVRNYARRTPLGRMADAGEIAHAAVFLASDASSYMTGSNLIVDGGWTAC